MYNSEILDKTDKMEVLNICIYSSLISYIYSLIR